MANERFTTALEVSREVELTVTGRKSSREITDMVWFVHERDRLYLLPVSGTDSGWFKNVLANPAVRLAAGGTQITARAKPITDPAVVGQVVAMFRAEYGSENVDRYYPKRNAAVEVPLD
jgi:deazaflavin-dependent oxidoreductase (nitroreductase family)